MALRKQILVDSIHLNENDSHLRCSGPRLLICRSRRMFLKIRHKTGSFKRKLSDNLNLRMDENLSERSIFESEHVSSYLDGWSCSNQLKKPQLYEMIWSTIQQHEQPDLMVKIGDVVFKCYSAILGCYTKHFSSSKLQSHIDLGYTKLETIAFMKFYNWMLQETAAIAQNDVLHLLCASEVLNVEELKDQCRTVLDNSDIYTESVAYKLYCGAKQYDVESIKLLLMPRIWKFFLTLLATEDFIRMESDEVCQWLRANTIGVNSEMEVFYGAVLWVNSKWLERKGKALRRVMSCVRFGLFPPWFLVSLHTAQHGCDVERVVNDSKVKKLITDGLSLTTAMLFYSKNPNDFDEFLKRGKLQIPLQRKWIVDKNCPYHYCQTSKDIRHVSYEKFIEYLQSLKLKKEDYWRDLEAASENHWSFVFNTRPNPHTLKLT